MFTIGIIGYGAFGAFLHRLAKRFIPEVEIKVYSSSREPDAQTFFSLDDVAKCDAVILTVPISAYERYLELLSGKLRNDSLIVDVATVKVHTVNLIRRILPGQPHLCTHPMFGPESYEKREGDVSGFRVVVAESDLPAELMEILFKRLREIGFSVIEKSADDHDREMSETLFLTHYVGQVIARGGFERSDIDTVSFGYLMDAVDSVRHDIELFQDVSKYNPYCQQVVERFDYSERDVRWMFLKALPTSFSQREDAE